MNIFATFSSNMSGMIWVTVLFHLCLLRSPLPAATDEITAIQSHNRCYWLYDLKKVFREAKETCVSAQQELALFDDNSEFNDVVSCLGNYFKRQQRTSVNVWIDFRINKSCDSFSWKNETFQRVWGDGNPNLNCKPNCNTSSCCARLKWDNNDFQKLRDHDCNDGYNFICKLKGAGTTETCTTKDNSPLKSFMCSCGVGYKLNTGAGRCEDVDECQNSTTPCSQECVNTQGSFECGCGVGYRLNQDGKTCDDLDECAQAQKSNCSQNCSNTPGSYRCECYPGYNLGADNVTCLDLDECPSSPCPHQCNNTAGSYHCTCPIGHTLSTNGTTCLDADECEDTKLCPAACTNTVGSYTCGCHHGYQDINNRCVDVDECVDGLHNCSHTCHNFDGGYNCSCLQGFTIPDDNRFECHDIDECHDDNQTCQHICTNTNGSYDCTCNKGYTLGSDNRSCHDINECQLNTTICGHFCNNTQGSFYCSCPKGFKLDVDGHSCVTKITDKQCPCSCLFTNRFNATNLSASQQQLRELIRELTVSTRDTSTFTRSKTSAEDKRGSSETVGGFGVVIVALGLGAIIVPDLMTAVRYAVGRLRKKQMSN